MKPPTDNVFEIIQSPIDDDLHDDVEELIRFKINFEEDVSDNTLMIYVINLLHWKTIRKNTKIKNVMKKTVLILLISLAQTKYLQFDVEYKFSILWIVRNTQAQ